ncbi:MAG: hypothetical protein J6V14_06930, partial [Clostridia bacterium]|nr:hypothetical protein [Clostridia bacterium]
MSRRVLIITGVILMCALFAGGAGTGAADNNVRLVTGVRVGAEELSEFQGADNMLMANAVDSDTAETELVVHIGAGRTEGLKLALDGESIAPETPVKVALNDGFNSFTLTAEQGGNSETVFVNVERLPAGLYAESTRPL